MNGLVWIVELYCVGCGKWLFGWPWRPAGFFSFCVAIRFIQCLMEGASAGVWIGVSFFCGLLASGEDMSLGRLSWLHEGWRVDNGG